jgi:hypothetical protein
VLPAPDEHELAAGPVRRVPHVDDLEPMVTEIRGYLVALTEPKGRGGRERRDLAREAPVSRIVMSGNRTSSVSSWKSTGPVPSTTTLRRVTSGVHCSQARASGFRDSNTTRPPGRRTRRAASRVAPQSSSATIACATLPVIVTRSTAVAGVARASPTIHVTVDAPGLRRATSIEASAGSIPTTPIPREASRSAKVPVPQPMSSASRAPDVVAISR